MVPTIPLSANADTPRCAYQPCVNPPTSDTAHCLFHLAQITYGSPLTIEPLASIMWLREVAAGYDPGRDEHGCIVWPFKSKSTSGYGYVAWTINGQRTRLTACRLLCEMIHGKPPDEGEWHAAHECGRGHLGCTTPDHLSWKTPKENNADKRRHGTTRGGESHHTAKLTDAEVREILLDSRHASKIAADFGVTSASVTRLKLGQRRRDVFDAVVGAGLEIPRSKRGGVRSDGTEPVVLTADDVRAIRSSPEPAKDLAAHYRTSPSNIRAIRTGLTWRRICDQVVTEGHEIVVYGSFGRRKS